MRTITAAQQGVLDSGNQSEHVRVSIKDSGGTFRDMTTYPGFNAVQSVTWAERVDQPHMTCDLVLMRESFALSLAPLVTGSALNHGFVAGSAYAPLLALNREVKVEVAIAPMDRAPQSGDWMEVFRGRIDDIDPATDTNIRVSCRSLGGRLAQQYIKTEYVYSYATDGGVAKPLRVWEPQMPVVLNTTYCLPASRGASDPGYNRFLKCSQTGTTGTTEPVWTGAANQTDGTAKWDYIGAPTVAGTPVEQVMQNILDGHKSSGDPTVTLYVPTSPSWAIKQFIQSRQFVLDALLTLAHQIGWDLRYKWRAATSQFELTLFTPTRTGASVNFTFSPSSYENPTRLAQRIDEIRNSWRLVYSDSADLWPDGQPKRKVLEVSDAASITKYGELWAEIQEDQAGQIDSAAEATTLVNSALADCKEPNIELSVPLVRGFPWVELNDFYTFTANGLHFSADQSLAVMGWSQSFDGARLKTTLDTRGQPGLGAVTWIADTVHPRIPVRTLPPQLQVFNGKTTDLMALSQNVGGLEITTTRQLDKARLADVSLEVHVSAAQSFTPDATTLRGIVSGTATRTTVNDAVPGKTYYAKTVPRSVTGGKVVRGQPSVEKSLAAGRAKAGHYDSGSTPGLLPLNGNFEHASDDINSAPPDHWEVVPTAFGDSFSNFWGPDDGVFFGTDATKGQYVTLRTGNNDPQRGVIRSSMFEVRRGALDMNFYVSIRKSASSAAANDELWMVVECFTLYGGSVTSSVSFNFSASSGGAQPTPATWYNLAFAMDPGLLPIPDGINFIRIKFYRGDSTTPDNFGAVEWDVGDVYCETTGQHSAKFNALTVYGGSVLSALDVNGAATFYDTVDFSSATVSGLSFPMTRVRAKTGAGATYASGVAIVFGTEDYDVGGEYNNTTGIFTATVAGKYQVSAAIFCGSLAYNLGNSVQATLVKNGTAFAYGYRAFAPSTASWYLTSAIVTTLELAIGDTLKVAASTDRSGGITLYADPAGNYFSIDRLI